MSTGTLPAGSTRYLPLGSGSWSTLTSIKAMGSIGWLGSMGSGGMRLICLSIGASVQGKSEMDRICSDFLGAAPTWLEVSAAMQTATPRVVSSAIERLSRGLNAMDRADVGTEAKDFMVSDALQ